MCIYNVIDGVNFWFFVIILIKIWCLIFICIVNIIMWVIMFKFMYNRVIRLDVICIYMYFELYIFIFIVILSFCILKNCIFS